MPSNAPLVVENVRKHFRQGDRSVAALDGVSLEVPQGQFVGGEQRVEIEVVPGAFADLRGDLLG